MMFVLDARLDLSAEEEHLFRKYGLQSLVVYDSDAFTRHADAAYTRFDQASNVSILNPSFADLTASLWNNLAGAAESVMTALSLRITLGDLAQGVHVECEDLQQILIAEQNIYQAAQYVAEHFRIALTFSDAREELHEV